MARILGTVKPEEPVVKTLNLKVSEEIHRQLRLLAAHSDKTAAELVSELITAEWQRISKDILK